MTLTKTYKLYDSEIYNYPEMRIVSDKFNNYIVAGIVMKCDGVWTLVYASDTMDEKFFNFLYSNKENQAHIRWVFEES